MDFDSNPNGVGEIISPGFEDGLYDLGLNCRWSIEIPDEYYEKSKSAIYFTIEEISIAPSSECYADYLKFSDSSYTRNYTYCNDIPVQDISIESQKAFIEFNTYSGTPFQNHLYRGFKVVFQKIEISSKNECLDEEEGKFHCLNKRCIDQSKVCDGNNDCFDFSDEMYCNGIPKCGNQTVKPVFDTSIYPNSLGIVGGEVAEPYSWPWQAFDMVSGQELCGASLIAPYWLFSAAHCYVKNSPEIWGIYKWVLGRPTTHPATPDTEQTFRMEAVYWHPWYDTHTRDWDYAVIKTKEKIMYSDYISPVCLPPTNTYNIGPNQPVVVTGYGDTQFSGGAGQLKQAVVRTWNNTKCDDSLYANTGKPAQITDQMVCAGYEYGGHDACQGDSGGPLNYYDEDSQTWLLYGVVSWGWGCAEPHLPGVYSRVSLGMDWAYQVMLKNGWRGDE